MYPRPIQAASAPWRIGYQALLPVALIAWLLPLIAVAIFSIKPEADFSTGEYWNWPSRFAGLENYALVFTGSDMPRYLLNSVLITVPTVIGAVALSCMTGFALAVYGFRGNLWVFFMFVAGNFVPFQILMVPVRDLTVDMGLYNTKSWPGALSHRVSDRVLHPLHAQLHPRLAKRADRGGAGRGRVGDQDLLVCGPPPDAPGDRGAERSDLHLHLERLFLGRRADPRRREPAGHRRDHQFQRAIPRRISPHERRQHRRRASARDHLFPDATPFRRRPDARRGEMTGV